MRWLLALALVAEMYPTRAAAAAGYKRPVEMRLLILATNGEEAGLAALRSFLDFQGTPYEVIKLAAGQPLPKLSDGAKGFYQGVILTLGNLGFCNPDCKSALDADGWRRLDEYTRDYGVRTLSYYTYPEARYGLTASGSVSTTLENPLVAEFTRKLRRFSATLRLPGRWRSPMPSRIWRDRRREPERW